MGFSALEIAGLALIGIATVMQISAVGTLKWRTAAGTTPSGQKFSQNFGLFRRCSALGEQEVCIKTTNTRTRYVIERNFS